MRRLCILLALLVALAVPAAPNPSEYFRIQVVDAATGRGIPLVKLTTAGQVAYWTDSNGLVAFHDPALMGRKVFFSVSSPGYTFPKDGFGYAGATLQTAAGGRAVLKMTRRQVAERLYRTTGEGIYADTVLLGERAPIRRPLLDALVMGQDSVLAIPYRGRIFWLWGDTLRPGHPLGNFHATGATSDPHEDPSRGVNLDYFTAPDGFVRGMMPLPGPGVVWLDGLLTERRDGRDRLMVHYEHRKSLTELLDHGIAVFDDAREVFEKLKALPRSDRWRHPREHPVGVQADGRAWWYFLGPDHAMRVPAGRAADSGAYESFTCMDRGRVLRGKDGRARYRWTKGVDPIGQAEERALVRAGKLRRNEAHFLFEDTDSGRPVRIHNGSVCWNPWRRRWLCLGEEEGGRPSFLGEVWLAFANTPVGPWRKAKKIATHGGFTFYNPVQHPFFDQDGGRVIYFEGTYTRMFSSRQTPTPRYEYNQLMYRVDLSDPRLRGIENQGRLSRAAARATFLAVECGEAVGTGKSDMTRGSHQAAP